QVLVVVGIPSMLFYVLCDRISYLVALDRVFDVAGVALEGELGRVDADDRQAVPAIAGIPGLQVGEGANAVDAAVGPKVDEDHASPQPRQGQRPVAGGVEPALVADEFRR